MIEPLETPYDFNRRDPYPADDFFALVDDIVGKYFYGFLHPVALRMLDGTMSPDELRALAIQEYPYYASTTWWNALKLAQSDTLEQQRRLHGPLLDELGMDLVREGDLPAHSELFLRYCDALGLRREDVLSAPIAPGVALAVTELRRIAYERPAFEFIACSNLVVERMRPLHYQKLLQTFATHYSWVPRDGLLFYEVHAHLDTTHVSIGRRTVCQYVRDNKQAQDAAFSAVLRSLCLRLVMYDGIERALGPAPTPGLRPWPNFPREPWPRASEGN